MQKKIAVSGDVLSPVKQALRREGFETVEIENESSLRNIECDAVIISGMDRNFSGMQNIVRDVPLIEASGRTPEEIVQEVREKLH